MGKTKKKAKKAKKHKKSWGPGHPLYDWKQKHKGKASKFPKRKKGKKRKKMPANVAKYFKLRGEGKSKAEAKKLAGL
jgi:hypothetical protein